MPITRTLDFLPGIFRTETNKKFLSATLDQLVSEPEFTRLNGYIGRKFAPTYQAGDSYIAEVNSDRQNYQLEPSVVVKDSSNQITYYSSYTDLINIVSYYGGKTTNHDRLFESEYYSYDGKFDYDKFVNFGQYYWLPNGPDPIAIKSTLVASQETFGVTRNTGTNEFVLSGQPVPNPDITLLRGGLYKFQVSSPGTGFWIQTEPGVAGFKKSAPTVSSRVIAGVTNNGRDNGTIEFSVPASDSQDLYLKMPVVGSIDYAIDVPFAALDNLDWGDVVQNYNGLDGMTISPVNKLVIFLNINGDDAEWTRQDGSIVPANQRRGVWRVHLVDNRFTLQYVRDIPVNSKVYVRSGRTHADIEYYHDIINEFIPVPALTAQLDTLYYQDAADPGMYGRIRIVDEILDAINVTEFILGKPRYTSPSGVVFSNGMLVTFDSNTMPAQYANNTFVVEGVGTGITLTEFSRLVTPEVKQEGETVLQPDYFVCNRGSLDLNAWARGNRWFHSDIIIASAAANGTVPLFDQTARAKRPIIEFETNLQLFNNGRIGKRPVDQIVTSITDAFNQVEHYNKLTVGDVVFNVGDRVLFVNDIDPVVRGQVYVVAYGIKPDPTYQSIYDGTGTGTISVVGTAVTGTDTAFVAELQVGSCLYSPDSGIVIGVVAEIASDTELTLVSAGTATDSAFLYRNPKLQLLVSPDADDSLLEFDTIVATSGSNAGVTYWYNGTVWHVAQQKTAINQAPQFDAYDYNNNSYSTYLSSNFTGTSIFSYGVGSGVTDTVLGFPLAYSNGTGTIADISFVNNFDVDTFQYTVGKSLVKKSINLGYIRKNLDRYNFVKENVWNTVKENTKQYQIISNTFSTTNYFEIDVLPNTAATIPYIKVFVNNVLQDTANYRVTTVESINAVEILTTLAVGDKIDILIYSDSTSTLGYYQIPSNLDYNSENQSLPTITLGQIRNHMTTLAQNSFGLNGAAPGIHNFRDLNIKLQGGDLLQHSAPTIYASLFLIDNQANFVNGVDYARREYTKFKNKFVELATTMSGLDHNNVSASVDQILTTINQVKNNSFPWYYSDMVPYGQYTSTAYTVVTLLSKQYKISAIYDQTLLQSRAVLVYLNNRLLTKDRDYTFDPAKPAIYISDSVELTIGAKLEIREYNTDGNYIPETPTKLGLYPKFLPQIVEDDTYRTTINVIQGHDGSLTPVFGDYRDDFLLELETRIYNNIKANHDIAAVDVRSYVPGRFRTTDYSLAEFSDIIGSAFLKWAGVNSVDYTSNSYFSSSDPFTYNYQSATDKIYNQTLPGYWRGIYRYFYDTDRPHTHPWEMLGFSQMPTWWTDQYGPAPYTSGNLPLWSDLELGIIQAGERAGIDPVYARPGLSKVLPVDDQGNLLPPLGTLTLQFSTGKASQAFAIGDGGPAESAWRRSSEYPYALQQAVALMKPARYFATMYNTNEYYRHPTINQFVTTDTNRRVTPADITLNGEPVNGTVTRANGYVNYVLDYLTSLGISATTKVRAMLDNLSVQLTYKVAGYTDTGYLTVLAEQYSPTSTNASVVIPDQNYNIYLNKGVPTRRVAYSAIIVEKTTTGYSVRGYNTDNPYFIMIPSETAGPSYTITSGTVSAVIYQNFVPITVRVPYGQQFATKQQLVDFLISYQRYLIYQGFVFEDYSSDLGQTQDWALSALEFLGWTLQGWRPGSILVLSPCETKLTINTSFASIDEITNSANNSRVLDTNFNVIRTTELTVMRDFDINQTVIQSVTGRTIAFAELNLVQFEHVLVFDNIDIFGDVIYQPQSGSRQFRLKLIGDKTANWAGALNPPGFIYNSNRVDSWQQGLDYLKGDVVTYKNYYYVATQDIPAETSFTIAYWKLINKTDIKTGLLPNFANNAGRFIDFYDVDATTLNKQFNQYSSGLIGFRPRAYLDDLSVDHNSQIKFYQGYIKDKGTKNAVNALLNAEFNNLSSDVSYYEEWAVRVGEYGAQNTNQLVSMIIDESMVKSNPVGLAILAPGQTDSHYGLINIADRALYDRPLGSAPVRFLTRNPGTNIENDIETAGYVNINDVDATLFDASVSFAGLSASLADIVSGYNIWVAKDINTDWQVYRANETDNVVLSIAYNLDSTAKITTRNPHGFVANDTIVIKQFNSLYDGFYSVSSVLDSWSFSVSVSSTISAALKPKPVTGTGILFQLSSVRFNNPGNIARAVPKHGWKDGDRAWVDRDEQDHWAVYQKSNPWSYTNAVSISHGARTTGGLFGASLRIDPAQRYLIVGQPYGNDYGRVRVFDTTQNYREVSVLDPLITRIGGLGTSVDIANNQLVAGAPGTNYSVGMAVLYQLNDKFSFTAAQAIVNPDGGGGANFGYCVTMSLDAQWLYIGCPGLNAVYTYKFTNVADNNTPDQFSIDAALAGYNLVYNITDDPDALAVYNNNILLVRDRDYATDGHTITLFGGALSSESGNFNLLSEDNDEIVTEATTGAPGFLTVYARPYFKYISKIQGPAGTQFGTSIKTTTNGGTVVIGQPAATVNGLVGAGRVSVYTNNNGTFTLRHVLAEEQPTYAAHFGTSVDITHDNASIIVGAPGYSDLTTSGGAVYRFAVSSQFELIQKLTKPLQTQGENFGYRVRVSPSNNTLLVSSTTGTVETYGTFDAGKTTFDRAVTRTLDLVYGSGAVYIHDYLPNPADSTNPHGDFVFSNEFNAPNMHLGDRFGSDVDISQNTLVISSAYNSEYGANSGQVYHYSNPAGTAGWNKIRSQNPTVDVTSINRVFLYSNQDKSTLAMLDYIDPAKGKLLGIVDQDIDFKSSRDPANYNNGTGTDKTITADYFWGPLHVGLVWWNLDTVRYINYEQADLSYRLNNWGRLFPGSTVSVYEWVESSVPPNQYAKSGAMGTPLYSNNEYFVETTTVDPATGIIVTKYYYWVQGITTVPAGSKRVMSASSLEATIRDPAAQGVPFAAILSDNSIGLFNCQSYLSGTNTVLQIDYDTVLNSNLLHSEFELVQQGNGDSVMPERIINKLVDSISGADAQSNLVPDVHLRPSQKTGLAIRPRQTVIHDQFAALKNVVQYVNAVFATTTAASKIQNVQQYSNASFYFKDPLPSAAAYDYVAANITELGYVPLVAGTRVLVESDSNHDDIWTVYEIQDDLSYKLIYNQSYDTTKLWNFATWYATDYDPATKITYVVSTYADLEKINIVAGDIVKIVNAGSSGFEILKFIDSSTTQLVAIENGTLQLNRNLWDLSTNNVGLDNSPYDSVTFDYNFSIEVRNIMHGLANDVLIDDLKTNYNQLLFVIINYILSEQVNVDWIFKTSFINVLHKIRQLIQYPSYVKDNTEYYLDYINEVKPYRTQVREYVINYDGIDNAYSGLSDFDLPGYYDTALAVYRSPDGTQPATDSALFLQPPWSAWANNFLFSISSIDLIAGGSGYTITPQVIILSTDNSGSGATATCTINNAGAVTSITVTNGGQGYRDAPLMIINGNGTGARAVARMTNGKIRGITTTLKFDRVSYDTAVTEWLPGHNYAAGSKVSYLHEGYVATEDLPGTVTSYITATNDQTVFRVPNGYYTSGVAINGVAVGGIQSVTVNGTLVTANNYTATDGVSVVLTTPTYYGDNVTIVAYKNVNSAFNFHVFSKINNSDYTSANDRIAALYNPLPSQIPKEVDADGRIDLTRLIDGVKFTGHNIDSDLVVNNDTNLVTYTLYDNNSNGAGNINLDGGSLNSTVHAPEELVPGTTYDNLNMRVYTNLSNGTTVAYRISYDSRQQTRYNVIARTKTTYLLTDLNWDDTSFEVSTGSALSMPQPQKSIPGLIYINGEAISFWKIVGGVISRITRGVGGTGTPAVHLAGSVVEDAGSTTVVPGTPQTLTTKYTFDPAVGVATTSYTVATNLNEVKHLLSVMININKLPINEYYTVSIHNGHAMITFSDLAKQVIPAGTVLMLNYYQDHVWINLGSHGGLATSTTDQAVFLKNNPYN